MISDKPSAQLPVAVVLPAYNAGGTIARAVTSVLRQTCSPAEVILIDDGSSDSTWNKMERLRKQHPDRPIRTMRLGVNGGPASARNAGWNAAVSKYIAFLDADDAWHPRKLEIQYGWMASNPDAVLCGHRWQIGVGAVSFSDNLPVRRFGLLHFLIANRLSTPTVMLRRDLPHRFTSGKRHSEDYLLWMQIVASMGPVDFIDLPLTWLFKAPYGDGGLSADHWRMRIGEADTLAQLRNQGAIGALPWSLAASWSWLKFTRRMIVGLLLSRRAEQVGAHYK